MFFKRAIKAAFSTSSIRKDIYSSGLEQDPAQIHDIVFFRNRIFKVLSICLIPIAFIALVPGIGMAVQTGTTTGYLVAAIDLLLSAALFYVILNKRLKIEIKKGIVIATMYLLALFLLIMLGSFGPGIIYMLLPTVIIPLIFTSRVAQLSIWLNLLICIFIGFAIHFDLFDSMLVRQYSTTDWAAYSGNIMVFNVLTLLLINNLIKSLEVKIRQLSLTDSRQRGLLASQSNYVIRTDLRGRYTYVNQKFERDFTWLYPKILGQDLMTSVLPYHHHRLYEVISKCKERPNEVCQVILDKPKEDGEVITTLWEFTCIDEHGNPNEIQCVGIDISERIKAEQKLQKSLKDLRKYNTELQSYAYVISHNLRAPIANIMGLMSLVELDMDDAEAMGEYMRELKVSANSLDQIVKELNNKVSTSGQTLVTLVEEN